MGQYFDRVSADALFGQKSWEKAESKMATETIELAVSKANLKLGDIDYIFAGDLQNQGTGTTFGIRELNRPFFGLFGACSTMGESMSLGAVFIDGGFATNVIASASSHFCAAEKTFRYPLELGTQRPLTASWTVTGDGACVISANGKGPYIKAITTGKIIDMGIKDSNNMGAAMAPAAADLLLNHFKDLDRTPEYYDLIITGDLGYIGHELVIKLLREEGYNLSNNYSDCGIEIFDRERQDTHNGGSGCGCSASVFSYLYQQLCQGKLQKILFIPTGSLHSTVTTQQGETLPGIAHGVVIENQ